MKRYKPNYIQIIILVLLTFNITLTGLLIVKTNTVKAMEVNEQPIIYIHEPIVKEIDEYSRATVRFTSYYTNDACGSGSITGSMKSTNDFEVNENGWYTYEGKVVIATATEELSKWREKNNKINSKVPEGFLEFKYFDEVIIVVDGIEYDAIVLDSCGASYWEEEFQRADIFVSSRESAVTGIGEIIYKNI